MKWALIDASNICINIIEYDGVSAYAPDSGLNLLEVNDWIEVGSSVNTPEPTPMTGAIEDRRKRANSEAWELYKTKVSENMTYEQGSFPCDEESINFLQNTINAENYRLGTAPLEESFFPIVMAANNYRVADITTAKRIYIAFARRKKEIKAILTRVLGMISSSSNPELINLKQEI